MLDPLEIPNIFTRQECESIVSAACRNDFSDGALVGGIRAVTTRRSRIFWLDEDGAEDWVFRRILDTVAQANREHFAFLLEEFAERLQIAWYGAETGDFFDWHIDHGNGAHAARRKLTAIVQLSDGESYDGGDLETNVDGHVRTANREVGSALLLPSFVLHRVTPVVRGQRYSLVLWAHGPAFA